MPLLLADLIYSRDCKPNLRKNVDTTLNERGRVTYNDLCRKCQRTCKQSFRAVIVDCPYYLSKRSKRKVKEDTD